MTDTPPPPVAGTDARETTREMSDAELDAIDARAMAATPGPWQPWVWEDQASRYADEHGVTTSKDAPDPSRHIAETGESDARTNGPANAAHIAGLDPQTVRALVAMARRALR